MNRSSIYSYLVISKVPQPSCINLYLLAHFSTKHENPYLDLCRQRQQSNVNTPIRQWRLGETGDNAWKDNHAKLS